MLLFGYRNLGLIPDFSTLSLFDIEQAVFTSAFVASRGLIALL